MDYLLISIILSILSTPELAIYLPNSSNAYLPNAFGDNYEVIYTDFINENQFDFFRYDGSDYINIYPLDYIENYKKHTHTNQYEESSIVKIPISNKINNISYNTIFDNKFNSIIEDGLERFKILNNCDYSFIEKSIPFLNTISKIDFINDKKLFFRNDSVKAKVFFKNHEYSLKYDFNCPDIVMMSTFKEIYNKETLVINDAYIDDLKSISSFIKN